MDGENVSHKSLDKIMFLSCAFGRVVVADFYRLKDDKSTQNKAQIAKDLNYNIIEVMGDSAKNKIDNKIINDLLTSDEEIICIASSDGGYIDIVKTLQEQSKIVINISDKTKHSETLEGAVDYFVLIKNNSSAQENLLAEKNTPKENNKTKTTNKIKKNKNAILLIDWANIGSENIENTILLASSDKILKKIIIYYQMRAGENKENFSQKMENFKSLGEVDIKISNSRKLTLETIKKDTLNSNENIIIFATSDGKFVDIIDEAKKQNKEICIITRSKKQISQRLIKNLGEKNIKFI